MDTSVPDERAAAVVALKTLAGAKSRMFSLPAALRERLARCMALDTITALEAAVDQVLVVSDQPDLPAVVLRHRLAARVVGEPTHSESLNEAFDHGDRLLRAEGYDTVLACVGDLPALRASSIRQVLAASVGQPRSFLADHQNRGTTIVVARDEPLDPRYGTEKVDGQLVGSAERHRRSGAYPLSLGELDDARRDVDTLADLRITSQSPSLGSATASLIDRSTGEMGKHLLVEVVQHNAEELTVRADGSPESVALRDYDGDPALLIPGRLVHAVRVGDTLRCWA